MDSPCTATVALADLDPVLRVLWEALEAGAADAQQYFDHHGERANPTLYPGLVRYRALQYLQAAGLDASAFDLANLANNGIEIRSGAYRLRTLKADDGEVPRAGSSARRRNFYLQGTLFSSAEAEGATNLVVLWDYGPLGITEVTLACPLAPESHTRGVQVAWMAPVPHPAIAAELPEEAETDDDLLITFRHADEEGQEVG